MLFLPYGTVPNCTLLLAVTWANGNFWTECNHAPSPWTPAASAELYDILVAQSVSQTVRVVPFVTALSLNETKASATLFRVLRDNQIIVVPASCNVHAAILHDWRTSPFTFASAVLMHRPPRVQTLVDKWLHVLGLIGPFVAVMYIAAAYRPLHGAH